MNISVQVDLHSHIQSAFGEKSIRISLSSPLTVRNLLNILCTSQKRYYTIFDDSDRLRSDVTLLQNGRNVVFLGGLDAELANGDKIAIFPFMAGG